MLKFVMAYFQIVIMALSILSLYCNGLRDQSKRHGLLQWIRSISVSVDVVCLQEAHCLSAAECSLWFRSSGFLFSVSPGSSHSCGSIILFCPTLSLLNSWSDSAGRFLQCEFSLSGKTFHVCSIYCPNRNPERDLLLDDLHPRIDPSVPTVLTGDFNTVFNQALDCRGYDPTNSSHESSVSLTALFDACCVTDIWRYLHPSSSAFTWTRWDGSLASRIDLVGIPYVWVPSVESCDILLRPFSDHCTLLSSVVIPDIVSPGPGLWKLNTSILHDNDYIKLITDSWANWRASMQHFTSLAKCWEKGKSLMKGLTIRFCCSKSAACSRNRDLLFQLIDHLKAQVDAGSISCLGPYHLALSELANLDSLAAKGAQVHARVKWVEEGETSSAYFLCLEKKRSADRWISALKEDDSTIVSSPVYLCRVLSNFYSSLFSSGPMDPSVRSALLGNLTSSLDRDEAALCEGLLSTEECFAALKGMARCKAPGSDGLPMEFYLKFWHVLGADLVAVLNSCFISGSLSLSQRCGVISLSFKKGDRLDPRNWWPITLLNVDYKIAPRVIAGRLLKVIHHVVDKDQTCCVPGHFTGENVALLRDLVKFASFSDTPPAVLSLDQEEAFDHVDWSFMRTTLSAMGFGPLFIS